MKRICGSKEHSYEERIEILRQIKSRNSNIDDNIIITIKVVYHICFDTPNKDHIEEEVDWTISELNKDFAGIASNYDDTGPYSGSDSTLYNDYVSRIGYANIVFEKQEIRYHPIPTQTGTDITILDNNIKSGSPAINPDTTLNIWVANLSGGLLGYAQFPWDLSTDPNTDGVVIARGCFGRCAYYTGFDRNKTLTHEVGHWLGLYHTFQPTHNYEGGLIDYRDGTPEEEIQESIGDLVVDTPPQGNPTAGDPSSNPSNWPQSSPADVQTTHKHMWMNFMDYSDDVALFMFTRDQVKKARIMISIYRPTLLTTVSPGPSLYYHDFETSGDWTLKGRFSNNHASIVTSEGINGSNALALRTFGYAQTTLDLTGAVDPILSIKSKNTENNNFISVRPSGTWVWKSFLLDNNTSVYKETQINLPGPYGPDYKIMIRSGYTNSYAYFDDVRVE